MPCQASDSEKKIQKQKVRYGVHKMYSKQVQMGHGHSLLL